MFLLLIQDTSRLGIYIVGWHVTYCCTHTQSLHQENFRKALLDDSKFNYVESSFKKANSDFCISFEENEKKNVKWTPRGNRIVNPIQWKAEKPNKICQKIAVVGVRNNKDKLHTSHSCSVHFQLTIICCVRFLTHTARKTLKNIAILLTQ